LFVAAGKSGMMRVNVVKIIFIAVFILRCAAPALALELVQVETQSAGVFSLPSVWSIVSKDEAPEQTFISDWTLSIQQVLYARAGYVQDAVLKIFLIWGSDEHGNKKSLPESMDTDGDLVGALIGARYGNVSVLGEDVVDTVLGSLYVATYGAVVYLAYEDSPEFRLKRASLYQGDKRVLVLLRYRPEFEDYWHGHFETL